MYTQSEKKIIRQKFWDQFKVYSNKRRLGLGNPGKWIMNDTDIKQLKLKFHFDEQLAFAGFEIETRNLDKRIELFDKFEKLKTILDNAVPANLDWVLEAPVSGNKTVSRIVAYKRDVTIYNESVWPEINKFLFDIMLPLEKIFIEYKDYIKY